MPIILDFKHLLLLPITQSMIIFIINISILISVNKNYKYSNNLSDFNFTGNSIHKYYYRQKIEHYIFMII